MSTYRVLVESDQLFLQAAGGADREDPILIPSSVPRGKRELAYVTFRHRSMGIVVISRKEVAKSMQSFHNTRTVNNFGEDIDFWCPATFHKSHEYLYSQM
jgi:hypothetical protein